DKHAYRTRRLAGALRHNRSRCRSGSWRGSRRKIYHRVTADVFLVWVWLPYVFYRTNLDIHCASVHRKVEVDCGRGSKNKGWTVVILGAARRRPNSENKL